MGKLSKKLVMLITTAVVSSSFILTTVSPVIASAATTVSTTDSTQTQQVAATSSSNLQANSIQDGVILHAWCWSFNQIKAHLADIAAAGYTAIQTSPAQACAEGASGTDTSLTNTLAHPTWYYHYQPTYYTLGNYQLGTADEFKTMCTEAHKYGLKIVVDVVGNHLADIGSQYIDSDLLSHVHTAGKVTDWTNRYQVTQGKVIGMLDVDTSSSVVQNKMISYLNTLSDDGADGFRFDAAKSIELPTETAAGAVTSTYWTNIINAIKSKNSNAFIYGEVLQGDEPGTNFPGYAKIMDVTGSTYSWYVRSAVGYAVWEDASNVLHSGDGAVNGAITPTINDGLIGKYVEGQVNDGSIPNSKVVTFVETHDTYANGGASRSMSQNQIQLAWAMVAARAGSVPLYFNRPSSANFNTTNNYLNPQGEPYKTIGQAGSDDYKQTNVVEINKFHNAMSKAKAGETVSRINNNKVMKVERGNAGVVLVNVGDSASISTSTSLPNGTYTNRAANGGTFTVSNGTLTGTLNGSSMAILYQDNVVVTPSATISQQGGSFTGDSLSLTLGLSNATSGTYTIGSNSAKTFTGTTTISIGSDLTVGQSVTVKITATDGTTTTPYSYTFTKAATPVYTADVYFVKPSTWGSNIYVYAYSGTTSIAKWPGTAMKDEGNGTYSYDLPDNWTGKVIFTDGTNQYPVSGQPGLDYTAGTIMKYENGNWIAVTPSNVLALSSLTANKDTATVGDAVTFTAKATGGTTPYTYSYSISDGTTLTTATDGTATWTTKTAGTYAVTAKVTDKAGATQTKTLSYTVKPQGQTSSADVYCVKPSNWGSSLYVYAYNASGSVAKWPGTLMKDEGNGLYSYDLPDNWTGKIIFNDGGSNQYPASGQPGLDYTAGTTMKYENGKWEAYSTVFTLNSLTADKATCNKGETVTFTAKATGGTTPYTYSYSVSNGTTSTALTAAADGTATWTPTAGGTYTITATVKDATGATQTKTLSSYIVTVDETKPNIDSITGVVSGSNYVYTVNASGGKVGTNLLFYKFYIVNSDGTETIGQNYSLSNTFTTTSKKIRVIVQNSNNDEVTQTYEYSVPKTLSVSATVNPDSTQGVNKVVTVTGTASNVTGTANYKFVVKDANGTAVKSQEYSTSNVFSWTPTVAGTYTIAVSAKDSNGQATVTKNYTVTQDPVTELTITSLSTKQVSPQKVGTQIRIQTIATGTGTLKYRYVVTKNAVKTFTTNFSSSKYGYWTPTETGTYTIYVFVKDSTGKTISKSIRYTIK